MAKKLFAHVFRGETAAAFADHRADTRSADSRRWVFRDLVFRRDGYAPWSLMHRPPAATASTTRRDSAAEPLWADTQPWCHE